MQVLGGTRLFEVGVECIRRMANERRVTRGDDENFAEFLLKTEDNAEAHDFFDW